jgi:exportin-T
LDSILVIDQALVMNTVHTFVMNTLAAYESGATVKWNDAELAVYLVYLFGEINKCEHPLDVML